MTIYLLDQTKLQYQAANLSPTFPELAPATLKSLLQQRLTQGETQTLKQFRKELQTNF